MKTPDSRALLSAIVLICLAGCSSQVADGGTDVANGRVAGIVVDSNGVPVPGAEVRLMRSLHDHHGSGYDTTRVLFVNTDDSGRYVFESVDTGTFSIESEVHTGDNDLHWGIHLAGRDTVLVAADSLLQPVRVIFELPKSGVITGAYLYIPGSFVAAVMDSVAIDAGEVELPRVPAGIIPYIFYRPAPDSPWLLRLESEVEYEHGMVIELELPDQVLKSDSLLYSEMHE